MGSTGWVAAHAATYTYRAPRGAQIPGAEMLHLERLATTK